MKVLVCGDRHWKNRVKIEETLLTLNPSLVITGGAPGADTLAAAVAHDLGWASVVVKAQWDLYGKAAGPIRNRKMYDTYRPDLVVAFHDNMLKSRGTANMVAYAESKGCNVLIVGGVLL